MQKRDLEGGLRRIEIAVEANAAVWQSPWCQNLRQTFFRLRRPNCPEGLMTQPCCSQHFTLVGIAGYALRAVLEIRALADRFSQSDRGADEPA